MEDTGVIKKVTEPTDWVNSLVVVEKPETKKLRICLDPRDLNTQIKRPHYTMPTLDDVVSKLAGATHFSTIDARSGYWSIKLEEESSFLTTFNSPFGRYRFTRLPFGIVSAQDEFQRQMDEAFSNLDDVFPLVDDILIAGKSQQDHDVNLKSALNRCQEKNIHLNPDKLTVGATEVKYFGHIISAEGLKPDPAKVKAIQEMPPPTSKKDLQTYLGMVTYLSKFTPSLSETTKPMRDLLKEDVDFIWDENTSAAFQATKKLISAQPTLAFFNPAKPITLQVDASQHGLGAVLLQDEKPVAYASKSLTLTEQNYAQIEKELCAILYGCKHFHQYIYGHTITVQSDHKPLEAIMKNRSPTHCQDSNACYFNSRSTTSRLCTSVVKTFLWQTPYHDNTCSPLTT